ncbi:unnamed protein product [Dibothriocephalus latus]|uniref:PDZ domain-containing protein n=1 Tax=Dibothriocephalus latus TaxID=60516 RepID=A0A3P6VHQ2_DIBLA|nr:unnamed protein product [Dibothriocephalus latus]
MTTPFGNRMRLRRSFDTYNAKSAELENKTAAKTSHDDGGRIRQQPRIVVSEEEPLRTPKNETDKYSTLKGWFPESDSILLEDPKFPTLPSLSSVLSADSQQTVTSFSPPPSNQPHSQVSSSLRRNCVYVSRATVSPSRRINRALTLPAVRQRIPPPRLVDDSTSISDSSDIHSSPSHSTSVSLFELLQFCHLQAVVINSNLVAARLRPVWWADDPITYLGLRVTDVQLRLPESENLKIVPAYHAAPAGNVHTMATHPDSAFKPVTPRHNSGQPCVLLIEEVYEGFPATAVPELRAGQILVELNGVSLLSTPTNTDRLTLLRSTLLNVFRALDAGACRGVALTVATPNTPVSRSDRGDLVIKSVTESSVMLPDVAEISLQSQPPRRQQVKFDFRI